MEFWQCPMSMSFACAMNHLRGVPEHALVWLRSDEQATQFKLPGPQGPHLHRVCRRITKDFHGQVIDAGQQGSATGGNNP